MNQLIRQILSSSIQVKQSMLQDEMLISSVEQVTQLMIRTFLSGGKVLFCGNGGSAADAQHLAAEFSGRFYTDRNPLPSEALHCNTSYLTAVGNDYGFDQIYARLVNGLGREGDILVGLSTSGNSTNIIKAFEAAQAKGMLTVGMTGSSGGALKSLCDILINVPSTDTPRIQEAHITIGHIICQLVEERLFPQE